MNERNKPWPVPLTVPQILAVACTVAHCNGNTVGQHCSAPDGTEMYHFHHQRVQAAKQARAQD